MLPSTLLTLACATVASSLVIPSLDQLVSFEKLLVAQPPSGASVPNAGQAVLQRPEVAPLISHASVDMVIADRYIVVFHDDVDAAEVENHRLWLQTEISLLISTGGITEHRFKLSPEFFLMQGLAGYVGYFSADLVEQLQNSPQVRFIEKDSVVKVSEFDIQKDAPWGLSRVSHRKLEPTTDYLYDNDGGEGVTAYVIDTGIKVEHEQFEGRATWGEAVAFPKLKIDGHGHGTHCAGIIGSRDYGIAKKVDLVAVGVMNLLGSGTTSDIIKGMEFVVNDHKTKVHANKKGFKGSTVNMSIGGGILEALDLAVNAGTNAGLHISVAAGNENQDACNVSPARAAGPITVGASDNADNKADFSNWGLCVDVFAPGVDILLTFIWGDTVVQSGTSMASPHVAGLLSYYLSLQPELGSEFSSGKVLDPLDLKARLLKYGTKGVIKGLDGASPNVLVYNGAGANLTHFWE